MFSVSKEENNLAILAYEQSKSEKNLELALTESLLRIIEKLGLVESSEMIDIRNSFADSEGGKDEILRGFTGQYIDLAQQLIDQGSIKDSSLVLNLLLIVLYYPRKSQDIADSFYYTCDDALEIADNTDFPDLDRLEQLINIIKFFL